MTEAPTRTASTRSRKVKALLAGGLVLGVGAAVTLAAWTDEEWAEGVFGAGSFNIEGSTTGDEGSFSDNNDSAEGTGAVSLEFEVSPDNLSPGVTVAAPFVVRLDDATTYDGSLELSDAEAGGDNPSALTYGITQVASVAECSNAATGTEIVEPGTALTSVGEGPVATIDLAAGGDGVAGAPVFLCFQVTAGDALEQGQTTTANWQFVGTSVE